MFEDYAVIPLDLPSPPVEIDALRAFLQTRCESCAFTKNKIRYVAFDARKPVLDGQLLLHAADPRMRVTDPSTRFDWDPVFQTQFRELTEWFDRLPFDRLHGTTLVTQTDDIREHLDVFGHNNSVTYYEAFRQIEPMYYRVIFCDPADEVCRSRCFYITTEYSGEKHFVRLPPGTGTVAVASSTCYHGAVHHPGHYKSTAAIYGHVNVARHWELLGRSLDKFRDYAVRLPAPGPVTGPGAVLPYQGA